jgi:DNA-binding transcriptional LysR family regulator
MNLSQLRFASAVAATRSFTAAAAKCCVTQPTLSNGIAQLENELGGRLFVRTTRKVSLTPFGAHLQPYITSLLNAQDSLLQQAQVFLLPNQRVIRIGSSPLVSAALLGNFLDPFRIQHPDIHIVLRQMNMRDLDRMLADGSLDVVFTVSDSQKGSWVATTMYEEPLLYVPRGAAIPDGLRPREVAFKDIANETYVMVPDACGLASATRALFRRHRRKLHEYPGEAMSYQVLEEWAALGLGAAILPKSKLAPLGRSSFAITDKSHREVTIAFEARWMRNATQTSHLRALADHLRSASATPRPPSPPLGHGARAGAGCS